MEQDDNGIHMHCFTCHLNHCQQFPQCNIVYCPNLCGARFHQCKTNEHVSVCRKQSRPCVNAMHGCPFYVDSISLMTHLEYCPASVVQCGINWNRAPLYSKVRNSWTPFTYQNPLTVEGDLDIEFAIADQKCLDREFKNRMRKGSCKHAATHVEKKVSKLSHERLADLESLLNIKQLDALKMNSYNKLIKTDAVLLKNNNSDGEFVTYDELLHADDSPTQMYVTNTNMRESYHYSPVAECAYDHNIQQAAATNNVYMIKEDIPPLTEEEIARRREVHCEVKLCTYPLGLNVNFECLPSYFDQYPLYRFACNSLFRRDQFKWHVKNIHGDLTFNLNDWLMQRCPLARYGCPYNQMRLKPKYRNVRFLSDFSSFSTRYDGNHSYENITDCILSDGERTNGIGLLDLPNEILVYLFFHLDNLTLNNVAKTCRFFRSICHGLIDNLGIVVTTWCKKTYENSGTSSWKASRKVRFFTTSSSPIREWVYNDIPHIGQHMLTCPFFKKRKLTRKVKLPMDGLLKTHVKPKKNCEPRSTSSSEDTGSDDDDGVGDNVDNVNYVDEHAWMA